VNIAGDNIELLSSKRLCRKSGLFVRKEDDCGFNWSNGTMKTENIIETLQQGNTTWKGKFILNLGDQEGIGLRGQSLEAGGKVYGNEGCIRVMRKEVHQGERWIPEETRDYLYLQNPGIEHENLMKTIEERGWNSRDNFITYREFMEALGFEYSDEANNYAGHAAALEVRRGEERLADAQAETAREEALGRPFSGQLGEEARGPLAPRPRDTIAQRKRGF